MVTLSHTESPCSVELDGFPLEWGKVKEISCLARTWEASAEAWRRLFWDFTSYNDMENLQ